MDPNTSFTPRTDLTELRNGVERIRQEIAKIVVGQDRMVDLLVAAILADGHVLIEGVPGVAKTLTAKLLARTISVGFSRIQFTPDLMPSDVLGTSIFNQKIGDFQFRRGPLFSNIVLIDEINRAPAKTQAALFEVMEERQITMDGTTHPLPPPFIVMATQNPVEHEGTYRLPEAQLDRFLFKIRVGYPNLQEEVSILNGAMSGRSSKDLTQVQPVLTGEQLIAIRQQLGRMVVEQRQLEYIARIVHQTRDNKALYLGASPRASLAILAGAKAFGAIRGRDFITPDDIREVVLPVLSHRVILTPEKEMEGLTADDVIKDIVKNIEVPR